MLTHAAEMFTQRAEFLKMGGEGGEMIGNEEIFEKMKGIEDFGKVNRRVLPLRALRILRGIGTVGTIGLEMERRKGRGCGSIYFVGCIFKDG